MPSFDPNAQQMARSVSDQLIIFITCIIIIILQNCLILSWLKSKNFIKYKNTETLHSVCSNAQQMARSASNQLLSNFYQTSIKSDLDVLKLNFQESRKINDK